MFVISEPQEYLWQDFTDAYYAAGAAALGGPAKVVGLLEHGVHGFVNLPIVGYFFAPFGLLRPRSAALLFTMSEFGLGGGLAGGAGGPPHPARGRAPGAVVRAQRSAVQSLRREHDPHHLARRDRGPDSLREGRDARAGSCSARPRC